MCRLIVEGGRRCGVGAPEHRAERRAELAADRRRAAADDFLIGPETIELGKAHRRRKSDPATYRQAVSRWMAAWQAICAWIDRADARLLDRRLRALDARMAEGQHEDDRARRRALREMAVELAAAERRLTEVRIGLMIYETHSPGAGWDMRAVWQDEAGFLRADIARAERSLRPLDRTPDARGLPRPAMRRLIDLRAQLDRVEREASLIPPSQAIGDRRVAAALEMRDLIYAQMEAVAEGRTLVPSI